MGADARRGQSCSCGGSARQPAESQLKLLYTAISRGSCSLIFMETSESVARTDFCQWVDIVRLGEQLAGADCDVVREMSAGGVRMSSGELLALGLDLADCVERLGERRWPAGWRSPHPPMMLAVRGGHNQVVRARCWQRRRVPSRQWGHRVLHWSHRVIGKADLGN